MHKKLRLNKKKVAVLAVAALNLLSVQAFAAEQKNEETTLTREVVVTASRTQQEVKETPASVEVITREQIETMGAQTVRDTLALATSMDVRKAGMVGNEASIRGMATKHTLILIDGRRTAGEDTPQTSNAYELDRINLDNVERIEIVRGSGSALYGSDALGGVINIITKKSAKASSSLNFSGGSRVVGGGVRVDSGNQGKWAWIFDANFQRVREEVYPDSTNQNGPREFYNLKGTYSLSENQKIDFFYEKVNEHLTGKTTATSISNYENRRDSFGMTWHGKNSKSDYEVRAYYNSLEKDQPQRNLAGTPTAFDYMKYSNWALEGRDSVQLNEQHLLTFGGEYRSFTYRGTRLGGVGSSSGNISWGGITQPISERQINYAAFYLQDEWLLSDKLLLIPSVRYDHSDKFSGNTSPKIGLTYKINKDYRFKASYGHGFRAPSISELYMFWHGRMGPYNTHFLGNPDLKPEKSKTWEISFEGEQKDNFGKITFFSNDVKDLINTDTSTGPGMWDMNMQYVNVAKAQINGLELEAGRNLSKYFTVKVTNTYLDAIDTGNNTRLTGRARNNTTLQLRYNNAAQGLSAVLWNDWQHDYLYVGNNYSYAILNFTLNKKWRNNKYNAYFTVENITDKKIGTMAMYEGRAWRVGLNVTL